MLTLGALVVSGMTRVEVAAGIWRKRRTGDISAADAATLAGRFEAEWRGTASDSPFFSVIAVEPPLLERAASLLAVHGLRAGDAVQLASALAAREADPSCRRFACSDGRLADAAAAEGFAPVVD